MRLNMSKYSRYHFEWTTLEHAIDWVAFNSIKFSMVENILEMDGKL